MRTALVLVVIGLFLTAGFAGAAVVTSEPIVHPVQYVFQAYPGYSGVWDTSVPVGVDQMFLGYKGLDDDVITAVPGVFAFDPGKDWANFVKAAQDKVKYTIKNVLLEKVDPAVNQAADVFKAREFDQHGTANIRTWWPVMYTAPGTTWTLTILYGTPKQYDDDGSGLNPATYVHTEVWKWAVDADVTSMAKLVQLFHELPFGLDEVPLISDEDLFFDLLGLLADASNAAYVEQDPDDAGEALAEFEMIVADSMITKSPSTPLPGGEGTGIAETKENPAAAKLLVDAEYVGYKLGIFQPAK